MRKINNGLDSFMESVHSNLNLFNFRAWLSTELPLHKFVKLSCQLFHNNSILEHAMKLFRISR